MDVRPILLVLALASVSPLAAQSPGLAPGQRVRVTAPSSGLNAQIARVEAVSAHDVTFRFERYREPWWTDTLHVTVPIDSLRRVDVSVARHSHGAVFAVAGAFIGAVAGHFVKCSGLGPCYHEVTGALAGGACGLLVGASRHSDEWVPADLSRLRIGLVRLPARRFGFTAGVRF